jgi:hypothetical protein
MATSINPNSCNPASCFLVYNAGAGATAPTLANGQISFNDTVRTLKLCYGDILCGATCTAKTCHQEGARKQQTVTVVTAPSTSCCGNTITYGITIQWPIACGQNQEENFEVIGQGDLPDTTTTIATRLAAAINANPLIPVTATSVAAVVTLVSDVVGIDFLVKVGASISGSITTATTVVNVNPFGRTADLVAMGIPADQLTASANYDGIRICYIAYEDNTTQQPGTKVVKFRDCWIFAQTGATATTIFSASSALQDILAAVVDATNTAADYISKVQSFCVPS